MKLFIKKSFTYILFIIGLLQVSIIDVAGQKSITIAKNAIKTQSSGNDSIFRRKISANRIKDVISIDGKLDEEIWKNIISSTEFIEVEPTPGKLEKHKTEVKIAYDDVAIYIGAIMHESSQDSILKELTQRDNIGNTDWFGVWLDTYCDRLNGYGFIVTSAGVQVDLRYSPALGEDYNWNAVWESHTIITDSCWSLEIKIPFSAIRFSKAQEQKWGVTFGRIRKSSQQKFFWNPIDPKINSFVTQWGTMTGLNDIIPPTRLSLTPYTSFYLNHGPSQYDQNRSTFSKSINGGADVKWGINESFTLDATLIPDFGQVQSDNQVLNLSPYEVKFNENRSFFTEGTELFTKGDLFYSRRIGGQPLGYELVQNNIRNSIISNNQRIPGEAIVNNPGITKLINAVKISGRTKKGLGIGIFNAVSSAMYANVIDSVNYSTRSILTQPITNYNIFVLDQNLPNNSYVTVVNTNVLRMNDAYDANVIGALLHKSNANSSYALDIRGYYSLRKGKTFDSGDVLNDSGYRYLLNLAKTAGNFTWNVDHGIESSKYNPNDLGLLLFNNSVHQSGTINYNIYTPFWKLNRFYSTFFIKNNFLYNPFIYSSTILNGNIKATFARTFITTGIGVTGYISEQKDFFEPRREPLGLYYVRIPKSLAFNPYVSTDYRKKLAFDVDILYKNWANDIKSKIDGRKEFAITINPRFRFNNHFSLLYNFYLNIKKNDVGYVIGGLDTSQASDLAFFNNYGNNPLIGLRNVATYTNTLSATYSFNNNLFFSIRIRHYLSNVVYNQFYNLSYDGEQNNVEYYRNRNNNYNAFNIDALLSWWFAPGSQINLVWKDAAQSYLSGEQATPLYFDNLTGTINTLHNNNISLKILYYLDFSSLKRRERH